MWPEGAQGELQRERCVPKVLKLSFEVSECKPLVYGDRNLVSTYDMMEKAAESN
jgi:hypothetical protein